MRLILSTILLLGIGCSQIKMRLVRLLIAMEDSAELNLPDDVMHGALGLVSMGSSTKVAVTTGNWSDPCVWEEGTVPQVGERIVIPQGVEVTVDGIISEQIDTIELWIASFDSSVETELTVNTLVSASTGLLEIGTNEYPITFEHPARVIFADNDIFTADQDYDRYK